jgi:hypothetical protein
MGIQEILTYVAGESSGSSQRGSGPGKERRSGVEESESDRFSVSGHARALYEADQTRRIDVVRQRVVQGFYLKKEVLDEVVSGLVKEMDVNPGGHTRN